MQGHKQSIYESFGGELEWGGVWSQGLQFAELMSSITELCAHQVLKIQNKDHSLSISDLENRKDG
jgi:hypothetical protein